MSQLSQVVLAAFPKPPGGRQVVATTNTFNISWDRKKIAYYYDIFEPAWDTSKAKKPVRISKEKRTELLDRLQKTVAPQEFSQLGAFDGERNLFTWAKYPFQTKDFLVPWFPGTFGPNAKSATITITLVQTIHSQLLQDFINAPKKSSQMMIDVAASLNMLNIFVQAKARQGNLSKATSFYIKQGSTPIRTMNPLEIYPGLFQSVKLSLNGGLLLNVDVTMAAVMPELPLQELCFRRLRINSTRDAQRLSPRNIQELETFIKGLKVITPKGQIRTIKKVIPNVGTFEFERTIKNTNGQTEIVTIKQHFKEVHSQIIENGELGVRCGGTEVFPIRFLTVKEQLYKPRLPPDGVKAMMDSATRNPGERLRKIQSQWTHLAHNSSEYLRNAGITVSPDAISITGFQLDQPPIAFGPAHNSKAIDIFRGDPNRRGQWDVMRRNFLSAAPVGSVLVLDVTGIAGAAARIDQFKRELQAEMQNKGMCHLNSPLLHSCLPGCDIVGMIRGPGDRISDVVSQSPSNAKGLMEVLEAQGARFKPKLIIVILPENALDLYTAVKHFGDIRRGVTTQCVRWTQRDNKNNQYINNLLLKINLKMGGVNFAPQNDVSTFLKDSETLILGADVSHPAPGSMLPSIASVVASNNGVTYWATMSIQRSRVEIIEELALMVFNLISKPGLKPPKRVMYFRDGVSEGEFDKVHETELNAIYAALKRKGSPFKPDVLFLVVGKRHHHRFFPVRGTPTDKSQNIEAGLVVSNELRNPVYKDFYLQSQMGLKGTSIPAHYTILRDEIFSGNEVLVQQLAYTMCHSYARATKSVKIPAPIYYADLVCRRAKNHFDSETASFSDNGTDTSDYERIFLQCQRDFRNTHDTLKHHMYFV